MEKRKENSGAEVPARWWQTSRSRKVAGGSLIAGLVGVTYWFLR